MWVQRLLVEVKFIKKLFIDEQDYNIMYSVKYIVTILERKQVFIKWII